MPLIILFGMVEELRGVMIPVDLSESLICISDSGDMALLQPAGRVTLIVQHFVSLFISQVEIE